jgi:hypothetical protein
VNPIPPCNWIASSAAVIAAREANTRDKKIHELVLDALEGTDRPPELLRGPRVLHRHLQAAPRQAHNDAAIVTS